MIGLMAVLGLAACATVVVPVFPPLTDTPPDPVTAATSPCAAPSDHNVIESDLRQRLDALRAEQGLPALMYDLRLARAAQRQACDNAMRESIDHRGIDGSDLTTRLRREGFGLWRAAENTALIRPGTEDALELWTQSRPHRANLLLSTVDSVGLGRATAPSGRDAWVLVLGRGR
jgi:uncharacterized protein YkwD